MFAGPLARSAAWIGLYSLVVSADLTQQERFHVKGGGKVAAGGPNEGAAGRPTPSA